MNGIVNAYHFRTFSSQKHRFTMKYRSIKSLYILRIVEDKNHILTWFRAACCHTMVTLYHLHDYKYELSASKIIKGTFSLWKSKPTCEYKDVSWSMSSKERFLWSQRWRWFMFAWDVGWHNIWLGKKIVRNKNITLSSEKKKWK